MRLIWADLSSSDIALAAKEDEGGRCSRESDEVDVTARKDERPVHWRQGKPGSGTARELEWKGEAAMIAVAVFVVGR